MSAVIRRRRRPLPAFAVAVALAASAIGAGPVHAAECAGSIHSGVISSDETWCAGPEPHSVSDQVLVAAGVTLTIQPGVTVKAGWGDYIVVQGHLDVGGTAAQPVTLQAASAVPGQAWGGLFFDGSLGDGSGTITHAVIELAGANLGGYGGAQHAVLVKDLGAGRQVTITDSTIRDNVSRGLYVVNSTVAVSGTTFSGNHYPAWIEGAASVVSWSANTFTGNTYGNPNINYPIDLDAVVMDDDAMTGADFTLPAQAGLDAYVFPNGATIPAGRTMTVDPGASIRVGTAQFFTVRGHLHAVGTPSAPIRFDDIPGHDGSLPYWGGLYLDGTAGDGSASVGYATIEHGGDNAAPDGCAGTCAAQNAVMVKGVSGAKHVAIDHSTIANSLAKGLYVVDSTVAVTATSFHDNPYPVRIEGAASQLSFAANTFGSNAHNQVLVGPAAMTGHDVTLPLQAGLDGYYLTDTFTLPAGRTMTVEPGVTVRTAQGKFLVVQGDLQALGTAAQPIRFSDPDVNNAEWGGLVFDGPAGANGHLDHAVVEHGCQTWSGIACATLLIDDIDPGKSVVVEHSTVRDSGQVDLAVIDSPTASVDDNLVTGGRYGVYLATSMTVRNVASLDHAIAGLYVEGGATVDARHLTLTGAGQGGLYVNTGGIAQLRNSILAGNTVAVHTEGSGTATLDTNLSDLNTTFSTGAGVTATNPVSGSAGLGVDGYHLLASSDGVEHGIAGLASTDIDGDMRPAPTGTLPDLGADEAGDATPPAVVSVTRAGASPTGAASVAFAVTFSEAVSGVDATDFALATSGVTGAAVTGVTGTGTTRTVTVGTGSGGGTIRLDVEDDDSIVDAAGNALGGTGAGNGDFASGETYTVTGSATLTVTSTGTRDGWVLETRETGGKGGSLNATATTIRLGDDKARRQYRGILSFSTGAGLPDDAVITKVTLRVRRQAIAGGGNPVSAFGGLMADLKKGPFGTTALQATDFQATAGKTLGAFKPGLVSGWYSIDLTAGRASINRASSLSGVTGLRLRLKLGDNNNAVANYLSVYSGNATAASRPQLVIEYHLP
jgi:hypothetical protein